MTRRDARSVCLLKRWRECDGEGGGGERGEQSDRMGLMVRRANGENNKGVFASHLRSN